MWFETDVYNKTLQSVLDCIQVAFCEGFINEDEQSYLENEVKEWFSSDEEFRFRS